MGIPHNSHHLLVALAATRTTGAGQGPPPSPSRFLSPIGARVAHTLKMVPTCPPPNTPGPAPKRFVAGVQAAGLVPSWCPRGGPHIFFQVGSSGPSGARGACQKVLMATLGRRPTRARAMLCTRAALCPVAAQGVQGAHERENNCFRSFNGT